MSERTIQRGRVFGLALLLSLTLICLSGCASPPQKLSMLEKTCKTVSPYVGALSDPSRVGAVGTFGDVPGFEGNFSLYESAWNTLIVSATSSGREQLNSLGLTSQFELNLNESRAVEGDQLSRLTNRALSVRALAALDSKLPISDSTFFEWFESDRYTELDSAGESIDMTPVVAEAYAEAEHELPKAVIESARARTLHLDESDPSDEVILRDGIPLLYVASLGDRLSGAANHKFAEIYEQWNTTALSLGSGIVGLRSLYYLHLSAELLGLTSAAVPQTFLSGLAIDVSASGNLSKTGTSYEPQAHFYAIKLGLIPAESAHYFAQRQLIPGGWLDVVSQPTLASTFHAAIIFAACGGEMGLSDAQTEAWTEQVKSTHGTTKGAAQLCVVEAANAARSLQEIESICNGMLEDLAVEMRAETQSILAVAAGEYSRTDTDLSVFEDYSTGSDFGFLQESDGPDIVATAIAHTFTGANQDERAESLQTFSTGSLWAINAGDEHSNLLAMMFATVLSLEGKQTGRLAIAF